MIITEGKTLQQVSDEIAAKLIQQGERCIDDQRFCIYSDGRGKHCAVGWLLDEDHDAMKTIGGVDHLEEVDSLTNARFIKENNSFLREIQLLHDSEWRQIRDNQANYIQRRFGLNMDSWEDWINMGKDNVTY